MRDAVDHHRELATQPNDGLVETVPLPNLGLNTTIIDAETTPSSTAVATVLFEAERKVSPSKYGDALWLVQIDPAGRVGAPLMLADGAGTTNFGPLNPTRQEAPAYRVTGNRALTRGWPRRPRLRR